MGLNMALAALVMALPIVAAQPGCKDDHDFFTCANPDDDPPCTHKYYCWDWSGYECKKFHFGLKTQAEMDALIVACPESCADVEPVCSPSPKPPPSPPSSPPYFLKQTAGPKPDGCHNVDSYRGCANPLDTPPCTHFFSCDDWWGYECTKLNDNLLTQDDVDRLVASCPEACADVTAVCPPSPPPPTPPPPSPTPPPEAPPPPSLPPLAPRVPSVLEQRLPPFMIQLFQFAGIWDAMLGAEAYVLSGISRIANFFFVLIALYLFSKLSPDLVFIIIVLILPLLALVSLFINPGEAVIFGLLWVFNFALDQPILFLALVALYIAFQSSVFKKCLQGIFMRLGLDADKDKDVDFLDLIAYIGSTRCGKFFRVDYIHRRLHHDLRVGRKYTIRALSDDIAILRKEFHEMQGQKPPNTIGAYEAGKAGYKDDVKEAPKPDYENEETDETAML